MRRVVIAGCGYVGTALAERLAEAGDAVIGLRRKGGGPPRAFESGGLFQSVSADLANPETLIAACAGADFAVFAAAADGSTDDAYRATYVEGLDHFLDALVAARAPVQRIVFTSSTSVYAQSDGEWIDETAPAVPTHFPGTRMLEAEDMLFASPFSAVSLRLGGIYGPGRARMIDRVRSGEARLSPGPERAINRIHQFDCAGAIAHLLSLDRADPIYLGVDAEPASTNAVLCFIAQSLGLPNPPIGEETEAAARSFGSHKRCSNAALVQSGYSFRYPTYREGYASLLAAT